MELPVGTLVYVPKIKVLYAGMIYGYENDVKPKVIFVHDKQAVKPRARDLIPFKKFPDQENVDQNKITKDERELQGFKDLTFLARVPINDRLKIILQDDAASDNTHLIKPRLTLRQQIIYEGFIEYKNTGNVKAPITCGERLSAQVDLLKRVNEEESNNKAAELAAAERTTLLEAELKKKSRELVRAKAIINLLKINNKELTKVIKELNDLDESDNEEEDTEDE